MKQSDRVIKFRAWHTLQNEWWYFTLDELIDAGNKNEIQRNASHLTNRTQWTGLTDKAGKDIYEDDFVQLHEYREVYTPVIFNNGAFCVHGFNWWAEKSEVIGNYCQNPELID